MINLNFNVSFRGLSPQQESIVTAALKDALPQFVREVVDEVGWEDSRRFSQRDINVVKGSVLATVTGK